MSPDLSILQIVIGLVVITLPVVLLIRLIAMAIRRGEREGRALRGECAHCGYDLCESPLKCPECGTVPDPTESAKAAMNNLLLMPRGNRTPKQFKEAIRVCDIILRDSNDPEELNLAAWVLGATKHPPILDRAMALNLARRACELTNYEKASCLDTLGVCHAACGQFDEAIRYVEMAMQRCEGSERAECEEHLELFRSEVVYQEPTRANVPRL